MDSTGVHYIDFALHSFRQGPPIIKVAFLQIDKVQIPRIHRWLQWGPITWIIPPTFRQPSIGSS